MTKSAESHVELCSTDPSASLRAGRRAAVPTAGGTPALPAGRRRYELALWPFRAIDAAHGFTVQFVNVVAVGFPRRSLWFQDPAAPGACRSLPCACLWRWRRRRRRWPFRTLLRKSALAIRLGISGSLRWRRTAVGTSIFSFRSMVL